MSQFWTVFCGFGKIQKSKMADQDGRNSDMNTQLLRHVTSSPHDTDAKGDIFRRAIYLPSLVVIASIFLELQRGSGIPPPPPPPPNSVLRRPKKAWSE